MSSAFLTITQDIRDIIVEDVVLAERSSQPLNPAEVASTHRNHIPSHFEDKDGRQTGGFLTGSWFEYHVHFENVPRYHSNSISLRLVNNQLNDEVSSAIVRLGERTRRYKLDILFVNDHELYPTWLSVPLLTDQVEEVEVTLRNFGNTRCYPDHQAPYTAFGDGGPPQMLWCFYYMMESFLRRGPLLSVTSQDKKVSIQVLKLNFALGDRDAEMYGEDEKALWWKGLQPGRADPEDKRVMRPEWLADWLNSELHYLLSMGYHTAGYGGILHERIGTIQTFVEGELFQTIEPAQVLSGLSYTDPGDTFGHIVDRSDRIPRFQKWKKEAERQRLERGLPVILAPSPDEAEAK